MICRPCQYFHGRDTNAPIRCPTCKQIVGCFWHRQNTAHIRGCSKIQANKKTQRAGAS